MNRLVDTREPQWSSLRPLCTTVSRLGIIQLGLLRKVGRHIKLAIVSLVPGDISSVSVVPISGESV